jgi:hypothetical protein
VRHKCLIGRGVANALACGHRLLVYQFEVLA